MPQLIALTSGYAQFVQLSYFPLPIFAKSTIFGIFGPAEKIGIFGHFLAIFGIFCHFSTFLGDFAKIGANPPDFGCWGRFFQKSDTVARTEIDFSCYRVFFTMFTDKR